MSRSAAGEQRAAHSPRLPARPGSPISDLYSPTHTPTPVPPSRRHAFSMRPPQKTTIIEETRGVVALRGDASRALPARWHCFVPFTFGLCLWRCIASTGPHLRPRGAESALDPSTPPAAPLEVRPAPPRACMLRIPRQPVCGAGSPPSPSYSLLHMLTRLSRTPAGRAPLCGTLVPAPSCRGRSRSRFAREHGRLRRPLGGAVRLRCARASACATASGAAHVAPETTIPWQRSGAPHGRRVVFG